MALHGHGSDRWQFAKDDRGECRAVRDVAAEYGLLMISPDDRARTSWMGPAAEADVRQLIRTCMKEHQIGKVIICGGSMGGWVARIMQLLLAAERPGSQIEAVAFNRSLNLADFSHYLEGTHLIYVTGE